MEPANCSSQPGATGTPVPTVWDTWNVELLRTWKGHQATRQTTSRLVSSKFRLLEVVTALELITWTYLPHTYHTTAGWLIRIVSSDLPSSHVIYHVYKPFSLDERGNLLEFEECLPRLRAETLDPPGYPGCLATWNDRALSQNSLVSLCRSRLEARARWRQSWRDVHT